MHERLPKPVSVDAAWASTTFLPDRTPATESTDHFATVTEYRDGAVFLANYAGSSQWERHTVGDELVMVVDGETTMTLFIDGAEVSHTMGPGQLIVVPQGTWHRFTTPDGVRVMTVTPRPTDHHDGAIPPA
ncbi:MAG: cupin domain-containing protein [Actinomycetota bacterium]